MSLFSTYGYRSKDLPTDIALGITNGLDMSLWCYVYASIIFAGVLSVFLPVGILLVMLGWILVSVWVALTSKEPLHLVETDDQAVVIFGSVSALMVTSMGDQAATSSGLATILCVIGLTSLAFSAGCFLVARYHLSRMLELLPYPVVCGFMASIGWLLFGAGFEIMGNVQLSWSVFGDLQDSGLILNLWLSVTLGAILLWVTYKVDKTWIFPAISVLLILAYYLFVTLNGISHEDQKLGGWLFVVNQSEGGALAMLSALSARDIQWTFVISVIPQVLTILFLAMLYSSMTLTALKSASPENMVITDEFVAIARGNLFCAATCSPPGYTEVVGTSMYREFGASSRWMPLTTSSVGLLIVIFGSTIIGYLPKLLIGTTIFLFAFQTLYEWLYNNVRGFSPLDYAIVCAILGTAVFFGFMTGILVGIILTVLLFVLRYSMISAIHSRSTLNNRRSSVERSQEANQLLKHNGTQVIIYSLRGFLFFGTANTILDRIVEKESLRGGQCKAFLLDMSRVTGVDISALVAFTQIMQACEAEDIVLAYSSVPRQIKEKLVSLQAVSLENCERGGQPLVFDESDFALEYLENLLLSQSGFDVGYSDIREFIGELVVDDELADRLRHAMQREECPAGKILFSQGDTDSGLYFVERGSLSAFVNLGNGSTTRVRKFKPGSLIGELSAYLQDKRRSATIIADDDSVLYHLSLTNLRSTDGTDHELLSTIHELVAATLAERVSFMNSRLSDSV
jgi:SulP family sulfate permease